jgi:hypothetical protein
MMTNQRIRWLAAATLLSGVAAVSGIVGALFNLPGKHWWLALWWGGTLLGVGFGSRWEVARKGDASHFRDVPTIGSTPTRKDRSSQHSKDS